MSGTFELEHPVEIEFLGVSEFHASAWIDVEHGVETEFFTPPHLSLSASFAVEHGVQVKFSSSHESTVELGDTPATAGVLTDPPVGNTRISRLSGFIPDAHQVKLPAPVVVGYTTAQGVGAVTCQSPRNTGYTMIAVVVYDREGVSGRTITPSAVPNGFNWNEFAHIGTASNDIGMYVFAKNVAPDDPTSYGFVASAVFAVQIQIFGLATPGGIGMPHNVTVSVPRTVANNTLATVHAISGVVIPPRTLTLMASGFSLSVTGNWTAAAPVGTWLELTDRAASFAVGAPLHTTTSGISVAQHTNSTDVQESPGTVQMSTSGSSATLMAQIDVSNDDTGGGYWEPAFESWLKLVLSRPTVMSFSTFGSAMADTVLTLFGETPYVDPIYIGDDTSVEPYATTNPYWSSIPQAKGHLNLQPGTYYLMARPYDGVAWDESDPGVVLNVAVADEQIIFEAEDHIADAPTIVNPSFGETFALADAVTLDVEDTTEPIPTNFAFGSTYGSLTAYVKLEITEPSYLIFDTYNSEIADTLVYLYRYNPTLLNDPPASGWSLITFNDDNPEFQSTDGINGGMPGLGIDQLWSLIGGSLNGSSNTPMLLGDQAGVYTVAQGLYLVGIQVWEATSWPTEDNGDTGTQLTLRITRLERPGYTIFERAIPTPLTEITRPPVPHVTTTITYDGTDITGDVIIESARFTSLVNGNIGQAEITVKDLAQTYDFTTGKELTLDVNGRRLWGGYVMKATKTYPFPALSTADTAAVARYWRLFCSDYNVLFQKRIVFDDANPTTKLSFDYPVGTYDDVIIGDIVNNYLPGIVDDGIDDSGVERVAIVTLDIPGVTSGKGTLTKGRGQIASAGYTWKQAMDVISRATGAVYYISPSKVFTYVDAETVDADYMLSDRPQDFRTQVGYQSFRILNDATRMINDMMVWGAATDPIVFSRTEDSSSISEHGRWQEGLFTTGIYHQATADIVADSYVYGTPQSLRGAKDDAKGVTCRVFEPVFVAGMVVDTKVSIFGFRESLPIRRMSISFVNPNQAIFDLTLSQEIDQPWSIFEMPPLEDIGFDINVVVPKVVLPKFKPPIVVDGVGGNPVIIDSFSRTLNSLPGDGYEHDSQTTSFNGSWQQGEHINWGLSAFFQDHHNPVHDGKGWLFGGGAHYILVHEEGGYPNGKPMSGRVDAGVDCHMLLYKIGITRHEKLVKGLITGSSVSPTPPLTWSSRGSGPNDGSYDVWGEWVPNYDTGGDMIEGPNAGPAPWTAEVDFAPDTDAGAGAITGTIYSGSDPGWGFGSDGGGMVGWTRRYAGGTRWAEGEENTAGWSGGPGYYAGHSVEQVNYTAEDVRDPATWPNMVWFAITGDGNSKVIFDKHAGGPANSMVISTVCYGGTPVTVSTQSFEFLPEEEYWVRWWRPNQGRSYARVWKVGDAEPVTWPIVSETASPPPLTTSQITGQKLGFTISSQEYQTYWLWCDIVAAGMGIGPATDVPPDDGESQTEPGFGDGLVYDLGVAFIKESTEVYVNGYRMRRGFDYTEQPTAGTITFESPPGPFTDTDRVVVFYAGNGVPL